MQVRHCLLATAGALALGVLTGAAQAGPSGSLNISGGPPLSVHKAEYRCWVNDNGVRRCRWFWNPRYREYGYPENYRTGSRRWWEEMDRQDRGGRR